jgi:hypothetical protein
MRKLLAMTVVAALAGGWLAACDEEGPAERTGEKIDNAVEKAGDAIGDAGREIERKTD